MKKRIRAATAFAVLLLMHGHLEIVIPSLSLLTGAHAQEADSNGAMYRANLQRTGVFRTKGVPTLNGKLWESEKLFTMVREKRETEMGRDLNLSGVGLVYFPGRDWHIRTNFDYSDPVIANGTIYFTLFIGDGYLYALDAASGKIKWRAKRPEGSFTSPCIAGDSIYVGSNGRDGRFFYAMNLQTQGERWRYKLGDKSFVTLAPAVADGTVYFGSSDGNYYALDAKTGQKKWVFETNQEGRLASPAIDGGTIYLGDEKGLLHAVHAGTGREKWKLKIKGGIWSLVIANDSLYVRDFEGQIYEVDAKAGRLLSDSYKGLKSGTHLAIDNQTIYFGGWNGGNMYAVDAVTRKQKWKFETDKSCRSPIIAEGVVYFSCGDGKLYAVDAGTGKLNWVLATEKPEISTPVIADGAIYFISDDGHVYAAR